MILSKFLHSFPFNDSVLLYHSVLLKKIILSSEEWNLILSSISSKNDPDVELINELKSMGFLLYKPEDDVLLLNKIRKKIRTHQNINTIFLVMTSDCNLNCRYCYQGDHPDPATMSIETAKKYLTLFANVTRTSTIERNIYIYGGEPLLEVPLLRNILKVISDLVQDNKLISPYNLILQTNGTIMNNEILRLLKEHNVSVGISLDGMKQHHDKMRCYTNGHGTFNSVMKTITLLKKDNIDVAISCTVGPHNYNDLVSIVDFFIHDLSIKEFGFNLLMPQRNKQHEIVKKISPIDITKNLITAYKSARNFGINDSRISKQVYSFINEAIYINECDGSGSQIIVTPSGKMSPCLGFSCSEDMCVECRNDLDIDQYPIFVDWFNSNAFSMPECESCLGIGICGGGCTYNRYIQNKGDINLPDKSYCEYINTVIEWMINELIQVNRI